MSGAVVGYHHWPRTLAQGRDGVKGIHQFGHFIAIFTCNVGKLHSDKAGMLTTQVERGRRGFVDQVIMPVAPAATHPRSAISSSQASTGWGSESGWIGLEAGQQGAPVRSAVWQWAWWRVLGVDLSGSWDWDCGTVLGRWSEWLG